MNATHNRVAPPASAADAYAASRRAGARPWQRWDRVGRYVALWLGLGVLTAAIASASLPVAGPNPSLAVAIAAFSGVVGLALLHLGTLRFMVFGRPLDLCVGAAFGSLALANLLVQVVRPAFA